MATCKACKGTGVCRICDGKGTVSSHKLLVGSRKCKVCNGKGKCPVCKGRGRK